jgi:hypothetical protein
MPRPLRTPVKAARAALVWLLVTCMTGQSMAQAVDCQADLSRAEENYRNGKFQEAISLVQGCIDKSGVQEADLGRAYRILGLVYIAEDDQGQARAAVTQLLRVVPGYAPDANLDSPPFVSLVDEIRRQLYPPPPPPPPPAPEPSKPKSGGRKWLLVGLGVLAAGAGALVLSHGTPTTSSIASPPPLP